jgi:hypothetical protein
MVSLPKISGGQCSCGMSVLATARPRQISRVSGNQEQLESSFLQAIGSESGLPSAYRSALEPTPAIRDGPTAGTCRVGELQLPLVLNSGACRYRGSTGNDEPKASVLCFSGCSERNRSSRCGYGISIPASRNRLMIA